MKTFSIYLFITFIAFQALGEVPPSAPVLNTLQTVHWDMQLPPLFNFSKKNKKVDTDEELVQKLKSALETIYNKKKIRLNDFNIDKSDSEITLTGEGVIYGESITLTSTFTTSKKILSIVGTFKAAGTVKKKAFKRFTAGKNLKNWIPEALQSNIVINNISMTFDENSQKP